jgi:hypothetical protein
LLAASLAVTGWLFLATGCANRLAFGTATKFGLDVSQRPDQTVEMSVGYDRMEIVVIPSYTAAGADGSDRQAKDATSTGDTYSVIGTFQVKHGNPFAGQPLIIHQFFATGRAAAEAARNPTLQETFGATAGDIYRKGQAEVTRP